MIKASFFAGRILKNNVREPRGPDSTFIFPVYPCVAADI